MLSRHVDTTQGSLNFSSSCANVQTRWRPGRGASKGKRDTSRVKLGNSERTSFSDRILEEQSREKMHGVVSSFISQR